MHPILQFENLSDLAFAVLGAGIGLAVLLARPRDPANLYFAAFMGFLAWGVVAGVFYINASEDLSRLWELQAQGADVAPQIAAAGERVVHYQRMFWIPYLFDPLTLLYFASVYPRRNWLHRASVLLPFATAGLVLLAVNVLAPMSVGAGPGAGAHVGPFASTGMRVVLAVYMLAAYFLALAGLSESLWSGGVVRQRAKLLLIGLGIAVFARVGLLPEEFPALRDLIRSVDDDAGLLALRVVQIALSLATAALFFAWMRRSAPAQDRPLAREVERATYLGIGGIAAIVWLPHAVTVALGADPAALLAPVYPLEIVERMRYSARWLVFGAVVGYSILRFQLFDLSSRARRGVLHASLLAALLGAFGILALVMGGALEALARRPDLLLLVAVAASVGILLAYDGAKRALGRQLREPDAGEVRLRKMEVYRAAVESSPEGHAELALLRAELGISDEEATTVELLARAPRAGPLAQGAIVGGRYAVERLLGRGGGGRVFLARDKLLDRLVVLKELDGADADLKRALAEAKHAGGLSHPNVVVVHDTILWGQRQLLVMEYLAGGTLEQALRERGPMPPSEATHVMRGALAGLAAVHARGIVHGDVKPGNVLLTAEGVPKISDFGLSALQRQGTVTATDAATTGLTLRYAAPEVLRGARPDARADVYASALVLTDMLVGIDAPGTWDDRLRAAAALLPVRAAMALRRAAYDDPQARFADAGGFLAALEAGLSLQSVQ